MGRGGAKEEVEEELHQAISDTSGLQDDPNHCSDLGTTQGEGPQSEELQGKEKKMYQKQAARANYLCLDRPDIGFAIKETMRRLSAPDQSDMTALKNW